jgi:hypothetical protein
MPSLTDTSRFNRGARIALALRPSPVTAEARSASLHGIVFSVRLHFCHILSRLPPQPPPPPPARNAVRCVSPLRRTMLSHRVYRIIPEGVAKLPLHRHRRSDELRESYANCRTLFHAERCETAASSRAHVRLGHIDGRSTPPDVANMKGKRHNHGLESGDV